MPVDDRPRIEVARQNARALGVESRITFVQSDLLAGIDPAVRFDLIVSNPPYVAADEEVDPEARWEPALALRAGSWLAIASPRTRAGPPRGW